MTKPSDDEVIANALGKLTEDTRPERQSGADPVRQENQARAGPPEPGRPVRADRPCVPSLALLAIDRRRRPAPATLCEQCPNAVWLVSRRQITCYCRVMYLTVWSSREPVEILECDGIWVGQDL